ncbi:MAG: nucleotidyltransferase domain-containing protein [candidate division KSB1 bacterium]|nr:nucleotidyltransferase domain-containing protein [candidate division KSB1 bacterium]
MYSDNDLKKLVKLILNKAPDVRRIVLFGSYAKSAQRSDSDLDIAVLVDKKLERRQKLQLLKELLNVVGDNGFSVDFIIKPFEEYAAEIRLPTLSQVLRTEGEVLWQKI